VLTFRADGSGRYDAGNYGHYVSTIFRWSIPRPGHITIRGAKSFRFSWLTPIEDVGNSQESFCQEEPFRIAVETTETGRQIPVFRADVWGYGEVAFGLETKDIISFGIEIRLKEIGAPE
jgi:hypothetical protein